MKYLILLLLVVITILTILPLGIMTSSAVNGRDTFSAPYYSRFYVNNTNVRTQHNEVYTFETPQIIQKPYIVFRDVRFYFISLNFLQGGLRSILLPCQ